jgi:lysine 2,3-aminomutase
MSLESSFTFSTSWKDDFRDALRTREDCEEFFETPLPSTPYSIFIPKPFALKIKEAGKGSPLWLQFLPTNEENLQEGLVDPISDQLHSVGGGIIHRYKNRVLFTPTEICPIQCRYCFRKNELHQNLDVFKSNLTNLKNYLCDKPQVKEVILTGGDPLVLSNSKIYDLLDALTKIESIKMVRFHTRTPIILPNRINSGFLEVLNHFSQKFAAISLVIHTNHLSEWTPEFLRGIKRLRVLPINLLSQSVLLKNVNDNIDDLRILFNSLYTRGITPYYLHHPDPVKGGMHFRVSRERGQRIYWELKKEVSGVVLPHYIIERPLGAGKTFALVEKIH